VERKIPMGREVADAGAVIATRPDDFHGFAFDVMAI
jgi:hypothetical protein